MVKVDRNKTTPTLLRIHLNTKREGDEHSLFVWKTSTVRSILLEFLALIPSSNTSSGATTRISVRHLLSPTNTKELLSFTLRDVHTVPNSGFVARGLEKQLSEWGWIAGDELQINFTMEPLRIAGNRDSRDLKDSRDSRDTRDSRDSRDTRDGRDKRSAAEQAWGPAPGPRPTNPRTSYPRDSRDRDSRDSGRTLSIRGVRDQRKKDNGWGNKRRNEDNIEDSKDSEMRD